MQLEIRVTTAVAPDAAGTEVIRSQMFFVKTTLHDGKPTRIDCGQNIWCELSAETQEPSDALEQRSTAK